MKTENLKQFVYVRFLFYLCARSVKSRDLRAAEADLISLSPLLPPLTPHSGASRTVPSNVSHF